MDAFHQEWLLASAIVIGVDLALVRLGGKRAFDCGMVLAVGLFTGMSVIIFGNHGDNAVSPFLFLAANTQFLVLLPWSLERLVRTRHWYFALVFVLDALFVGFWYALAISAGALAGFAGVPA